MKKISTIKTESNVIKNLPKLRCMTCSCTAGQNGATVQRNWWLGQY